MGTWHMTDSMVHRQVTNWLCFNTWSWLIDPALSFSLNYPFHPQFMPTFLILRARLLLLPIPR
jgi:hypothetical protein